MKMHKVILLKNLRVTRGVVDGPGDATTIITSDKNPHPLACNRMSVLLNPVPIPENELHQTAHPYTEAVVIGGEIW
jgi:hypothetical protein